ncbi:hypothetical protein B7494_g6397 [Chlorociboria aeruginascens]|nr:hypothetical protein B7494_g6397 [Chlorociboria aeruginascens]
MRSDNPEPVTPSRQTSRGQFSNKKNDESLYRKRNAQENSGRRGRKDGSVPCPAPPRASRRGYQAIPEPQPAKEDSTDEMEDASVQTSFHLRRALFKEVQEGGFNWESEDSRSRVQKLLYGCDRVPETLLHQMIDYLRQLDTSENMKGNVAVNGTSNVRGLEELAKFALGLEPRLLKDMLRTESTPLQYAIEKNMETFAKHLCNVAAELTIPGSKMESMNACQEAIHAKKDNETCLNFAIRRGLSISQFLVEKALKKTLLEKSGPKSNTPLHEAVNFARLGTKLWPSLVNMILKEEPSSVLELNKQDHSPYRHHLNTSGALAWQIDVGDVNGTQINPKYEDPVNDKKSSAKASLPTNEKEDADGDSEKPDAKGQVDIKSKATANNAKELSVAQARQRKQALVIQGILLECCLRYGGHKEAFIGLWGSFDGKPRTWINLLDVELSPNFDEKLKFRILEPHLGFVGVRVPAEEVQFKAREQPIKEHLVVRFFNWLSEEKGVREILKVVVKDDRNSPCSDEVIEELLSGFNVRYLDWDREDLSSKVIEDTMKDARGLSLYWSGNNAVLREWTDFVNLKMLNQVHLTVQQKWDSRIKTEDNIKEFKQVLEDTDIEFSGGEIPQRQEGDGGQGGNTKPPGNSQPETNQWLARMAEFTEGIEIDDPSEELPPVKVAIIDDGVDLYGQYHISDGTSFSHGTAMAEIMHGVCPSAIQWAVDKDVHIISMSWTINDAFPADITALTTALENANKKNIIMFCAARDEGKEEAGRRVYPYSAAPDVIIRIGATDYEPDCREGSWKATALAAGVAALVLFCFGAVIGTSGIDEVKCPARMKELFDEFADGHNHSVLPGVFVAAAEGASPKEMELVSEDAEINNRMGNLIATCRGVITARKNKRAKAGVH